MVRISILLALFVSKLAFLAGVDMGEDRFHLGAKAIIRNSEGKVLLLEKERRQKTATYWDLPGGRMNRGETLLDTLQRELQEEVSLQSLPSSTLLGMGLTKVRISQPDGDVGLVLALYSLDAPLDFTPVLSDEHINFGWFDFDEALALLKPQYPHELVEMMQQTVCSLQ